MSRKVTGRPKEQLGMTQRGALNLSTAIPACSRPHEGRYCARHDHPSAHPDRRVGARSPDSSTLHDRCSPHLLRWKTDLCAEVKAIPEPPCRLFRRRQDSLPHIRPYPLYFHFTKRIGLFNPLFVHQILKQSATTHPPGFYVPLFAPDGCPSHRNMADLV
ncbi:hypothetical protein MRX96_006958 [Rhipicephalus microplus]